MVVEALANVQAALAAEDWPRALGAALEAWRATRSVELADLIDRITARCELPKPPHTRSATHRWWMGIATDPDPLQIGALLAALPVRMFAEDETWQVMRARWPEPNPIIVAIESVPPLPWMVQYAAQRGEPVRWPPQAYNWFDRLAAMLRWSDDPRVGGALVDLLGNPEAINSGEINTRIARAIADRLIAMADRRVTGSLAKLVTPETKQRTWRQIVINPLITEVAAAIREPQPPEIDRIAACAAYLPVHARPPIDVEPLWQQVADNPDDEGLRLVLADALIAAGDNRGELIALQFVTDPERIGHAQARAHRLMRTEWDRWMGDLALVLARRGTEMRRGMLEKIRVGQTGTPHWAWAAIRGHRELSAVREVWPAHVEPVTFAKLVASFDRFPRVLAIDAHEVLEELLKTRSDEPLETAYYAPINPQVNYRRVRPQYHEAFAMLARLAPQLTQLDLGALWWHGGEFRAHEIQPRDFVDMLLAIARLFPKLRKVRIEAPTLREEARLLLKELAFVEILATRLGP